MTTVHRFTSLLDCLACSWAEDDKFIEQDQNVKKKTSKICFINGWLHLWDKTFMYTLV